jgi:hypothetical protein
MRLPTRALERWTRRERILAGFGALMAVLVAVLLVMVAARGPARTPVTANRAGGPPRSATAAPSTPASSAARTLTAGYTINGRWKEGFNAELTVTNLGSQPVEGWTVRLTMPDDVTVKGAWSAEVTQVASTVTLRSQPWNTYLGPGGVVRFGFQATGTAAAPESCTVNGSPC